MIARKQRNLGDIAKERARAQLIGGREKVPAKMPAHNSGEEIEQEVSASESSDFGSVDFMASGSAFLGFFASGLAVSGIIFSWLLLFGFAFSSADAATEKRDPAATKARAAGPI